MSHYPLSQYNRTFERIRIDRPLCITTVSSYFSRVLGVPLQPIYVGGKTKYGQNKGAFPPPAALYIDLLKPPYVCIMLQ